MNVRNAFLATLGCALLAAAGVRAADYPVRPVRIVIGFTPGGTPDITARLIGVKLSESFGQQIVVDNHPGAGGTIGAKLRALGISCTKRVAAIPDIPTLAESALPGFSYGTWSGILAPVKTPRVIISKLHAEITRILALPDIQKKMTALGVEPDPTTPAEFDKLIAEQVAMMAKLARAAGIQPQ